MPILDKRFSTQLYMVKWEVDEEFHNLRLDQFLMNYLDTWSRELIKKKIKKGGIEIKGRPGIHRPNTKVHWKDVITMKTWREELINAEDEFWNGEKLPLQDTEILYEDSGLLVIAKPPFMSTHPTGKHIFHCATVYYEEVCGHPVHSIHRLDRETSGVLLLGKTPASSNKLTENFEKDRVQKCYFFMAKVRGFNGETEFRASERIGPKESGLKRVINYTFPQNSREGKSAQTDFQILHEENGYVLGLAFPKTGRQHQIRVHAAHYGLPLLGDKLYLGDYPTFQRFKDRYATDKDFEAMELPRHALHSTALYFPYENVNKVFFAPIPKDFREWIDCHFSATAKGINTRVKNAICQRFGLSSIASLNN